MGDADAQKQAAALQEQLSKAEADHAAEVQRLQQAESKLSGELKQARLDMQQVLIQCCIRAKTRHHSFCHSVLLLSVCWIAQLPAVLHICMEGMNLRCISLAVSVFVPLVS